MIDLNRRNCLAGARRAWRLEPRFRRSGVSTAAAGAPPASAQAPGFYRYKVGSFQCTSINDGARTFPMPDTFVKNVPKEEALAAARPPICRRAW